MLRPEPARAAEGAYTALHRDPRPCEGGDVLGVDYQMGGFADRGYNGFVEWHNRKNSGGREKGSYLALSLRALVSAGRTVYMSPTRL